jgi:Ni/Fe-hydrogenase subunit HybB-like protein
VAADRLAQTHGAMLPYGAGSYTPTWVEYAVVAGLVALGGLTVGAFMKIAPIVELEAPDA